MVRLTLTDSRDIPDPRMSRSGTKHKEEQYGGKHHGGFFPKQPLRVTEPRFSED